VLSGQATVLIVDDDAMICTTLDSILTPLGYRVLTAATPEDAYALLAVERVDAALLDIRMPTMSGPALFVALVHRSPDLAGRIAFMSAEPDAPDVRPWLETHHHKVFRKPFTMAQIEHWLEAVVAAARRERRFGT
jgi:DNA-binding response OmpR family regulator